jgi:PEGA domain
VSSAKLHHALMACAGALVSMGAATPARAQPAEAPAASASASVKQLCAVGFEAANHGQWEQAYPPLAQAWELEPRWQIAGVLGRTELELGKYREAAEHLTIFLRETREVAEVDAEERANTERLLSRARAYVGALTIVVQPAGAEVFVDGAPAGKAPLADPVFVQPGRRSVVVRREGYVAAGDAREVEVGGVARMDLQMVRLVEPPPKPRWRGVDTGVVIGGTLGTVAALGVGTWFAVKANRTGVESRGYENPGSPCDVACIQSHEFSFFPVDRERAQQTQIYQWGFVAAGVLGASTVTYAIAGPKLRRPVTLTAAAGPGGAGTTISVAW